ncbi:zinc-binding dehydrogenase [Streptomyces sp. NBC_00873]|uniref:quinone oxidoreductase family protein n=1 Tax=unclassified Streptomyces TaxID=2593676 RepID=UPI0038669D25|nr:zinc-binding dehydrogenase [Streptomyces sp. NBC_00873]WTA46870.1 zinc-binding dehydrogenase [Streptomyces sp. NBC_00842]
MRAVRIRPTPDGGVPVVVDLPAPAPGPGQVLVRVRASGLNRGELLQAGRVKDGDPVPIGVELAGEIDILGEGVTGWKPGDAVVAHGTGTQAELVVVSAGALVRKPESSTWAEAGSFLNVYMTAHDALVTNGRMAPGEAVLINAATGGIGLAATQIARALGAGTVIATTTSASKVQALFDQGAHHVIDVSSQDQVTAVADITGNRGVDVIVDSVGGTVLDDNLTSLAVKGRLVQVGRMGSDRAEIDLTKLWRKRLNLIGVTFQTRTEQERLDCIRAAERDLLDLWERRAIVPVVDRTFPMEDIGAAYDHMTKSGHTGKIALLMPTPAGDR